MHKRLLLPLAILAAVAFAEVPIASAQNDQTVPLARRLFDEGVEAARKSQWNEALDRFRRSYELAPRLKTLFNLAGAQMQTGNLVDASESYRRFLRETSDGRYESYRKDAREALTGLEKRIPFVKIRVIGVSPGDIIKLNDQEFPQAGLGESLPIDPGSHEVDVMRDGSKISTRTFTIGEGDSKTIDIVVEPRKDPVPEETVSSGGGEEKRPAGADLGAGTGGPKDGGDDGGSIFGSGWFWAAVVVVAAGGATGAYFATRDNTADPTEGTLGRGIIDVAP